MNVLKYNILFFLDKEIEKTFLKGPFYKPDAKLRVRVRWGSMHKVHFNLGYRVRLVQWDTKTQRCTAKTFNLQKQSASFINRHIQQYETIFPIPSGEVNANPNIASQQNPGY